MTFSSGATSHTKDAEIGQNHPLEAAIASFSKFGHQGHFNQIPWFPKTIAVGKMYFLVISAFKCNFGPICRLLIVYSNVL